MAVKCTKLDRSGRATIVDFCHRLLGRHLNAQIRWSRPDEDPPDVDFHVRRHDGTEVTVWGEVTGVYYNRHEAKWLWGDIRRAGGYWNPDARSGRAARDRVECKLKKCSTLAQRRGRGHLLVLLHSPLTTRSTRVEAERCMRELLVSAPCSDSEPFETVWLGYRLPWTTPHEQEDPQHVFLDQTGAERFNFIKCIWIRPDPRHGIGPRQHDGAGRAS